MSLHVEEKLRRAIRVGSHDHLLSGVRVMPEMRRSLRPSGVAGAHFETASVDRKKIEHFVEFVDLGAELLGQIQVVRSQLILGVLAAADTTVSARDAAFAPWADSAEVWIVGLDAWAAGSEGKVPVVPGVSSRFSDGRYEVPLFSLEVRDPFSFLRTISRGSPPQRASRLRA
jgi:hypothetical protein